MTRRTQERDNWEPTLEEIERDKKLLKAKHLAERLGKNPPPKNDWIPDEIPLSDLRLEED